MARLSFSRWPSLFFLISKPHQPTAHTCFTVLAAKNIRGIDVKSDLWVKKYRHSRHAQGKSPKAPRECCVFLCFSLKKAVDKYPESILKPPLLQKSSQLRGQFILISQIATFQEKVCREKQSHIFGRHRWQTASRSYRITWDCISRTFDKVFYYRCET